jgi:hypothetical protein
MILRQIVKFPRADGTPRQFYGCQKWPHCNGIMTLHPDGSVMATPCDDETKRTRQEAHETFDRFWLHGLMSRREAYRKMSVVLNLPTADAHIGFLNADQCRQVIVAFTGADPRRPDNGDRGRQNRQKRMDYRRSQLRGGLEL